MCDYHNAARRLAAKLLLPALQSGLCVLVAPTMGATNRDGECHSTPVLVPAAMIEAYATKRGLPEVLNALAAPLGRGEVRYLSCCRCGNVRLETLNAHQGMN